MSANSTYRLTEHHTAGGMSLNLSHLAELQPELFCEVSPELATHRGLEHGGYATITTPRGIVEACVLVPPRVHPVRIAGGLVHQIGIPFHPTAYSRVTLPMIWWLCPKSQTCGSWNRKPYCATSGRGVGREPKPHWMNWTRK